MRTRVKSFIKSELAKGKFSAPSHVLRFAVRIAALAAIAACLVNVTLLTILHNFGLLPYNLTDAIYTDIFTTSVISVGVGFPISYVVGLAIHELSLSRDTFLHLSRTDMLSGLLNRRAFIEACQQAPANVSFALFDVDRFKAVNDTYGHDSGDRVIAAVARSLQSSFGEGAVVARIGGEEFAVLVEARDEESRFAAVEAARACIAQEQIVLADGRIISVTVSGGVAELGNQTGFGTAFAAADNALYIAKSAGRNRVVHEKDVSPLDLSRENGPPSATTTRRISAA